MEIFEFSNEYSYESVKICCRDAMLKWSLRTVALMQNAEHIPANNRHKCTLDIERRRIRKLRGKFAPENNYNAKSNSPCTRIFDRTADSSYTRAWSCRNESILMT